jgi:DNA invertase Pin-like site-specific DNA recombinase
MNVQQKRRRDKRHELFAAAREAARNWVGEDAADDEPFQRASDVAAPFSELRAGHKVFRVARVSEDRRRSHLKDQLKQLRRQVRAVRAEVVGSMTHVGSGTDSSWLRKAAAKAKRLGADYLLAETVDRCKRSEAFGRWDRAAQPMPHELAELHADLSGMALMTYIHPDAPLSECESYQKKRMGKCGRPKTRAKRYESRWNQCLPDVAKARRLHRKGVSIREIARRLDRAYSTVHGWLDCGLIEFVKTRRA